MQKTLTMRKLPVGDRDGYVLIELIATFAVVALIANLCMPALPIGAKSTNVEAISFDIVNLLRDARTLSVASAKSQSVIYNSRDKALRAGQRSIYFARDINFSFESGPLCGGIPVLFRPDGTNCGSILRISRGTKAVTIRVNWIDGGIKMQTPT